MGQQAIGMLAAIRHDFQLTWRDLILTDIVYKTVAFVVLTPLVSLLLRIAIAVLFVTTSWTFVYENSAPWVAEGQL